MPTPTPHTTSTSRPVPCDGRAPIYLDHAATTPLDPAVLNAMLPFLTEEFGNPSSQHAFGSAARAALEASRERVASCLRAHPDEILFTSGGTEADNTALLGVVDACAAQGGHIITTNVEHHAILDTCAHLEAHGVRVTYVPVDSQGLADPEDVRHAIGSGTLLVSVMHANNEVGTVQPIEEIGRICREAGVLLHTDAVQTAGTLPLDVEALGVDFLSLSAHKLYGPKGTGVLYARRGTRWSRLLHGGGQERGGRAGTESVAGIVGLAAALELAVEKLKPEGERLARVCNRLVDGVLARVDGYRLNGHPTQRLPGNASFSIEGVESESLLLHLDLQGIAASAGSACTSGSLEPSHVIRALGVPSSAARGTIRFSLGRSSTEAEIDYTIDALAQSVHALRALSPQ